MNLLQLFLVGAAAAILLSSAAIGAPSQPVYVCPKVSNAPVIDGKLDDEAWLNSPEVKLVMSTTGDPTHWNTKAKMCWDDENLYISFRCEDPDIWGNYTKDNSEVYREEVVEAFINPSCDLANYYEINVTPRNVIFQGVICNPTGKGPDPDKTILGATFKGLKTAVLVDGTLDNRDDTDREWTVEMAVPFSVLNTQTPRPGERWRLNLYRIQRTPDPVEFQAWSPTLVTPPAFHIPERFGTVFFSNSGI